MLTRIVLTNIGRMPDETVELAPLMKIRGPNQAGKSLHVTDMIEIMMMGDDLPFEYVTWGAKEGRARLYFEDGRSVEYVRTKSVQRAILHHIDGTGTHEGGTQTPLTTLKSSRHLIQAFTGGFTFSYEGGKEETPQFVGIEEPMIHPILSRTGTGLVTNLKWITSLVGGEGIAVAKQSVDADLKQNRIKLASLEEQIAPALEAKDRAEGIDQLTLDGMCTNLNLCAEWIGEKESHIADVERAVARLDELGACIPAEEEWNACVGRVDALLYRWGVKDAKVRKIVAEMTIVERVQRTLNTLAVDIESMDELIEELEGGIAVLGKGGAEMQDLRTVAMSYIEEGRIIGINHRGEQHRYKVRGVDVLADLYTLDRVDIVQESVWAKELIDYYLDQGFASLLC